MVVKECNAIHGRNKTRITGKWLRNGRIIPSSGTRNGPHVRLPGVTGCWAFASPAPPLAYCQFAAFPGCLGRTRRFHSSFLARCVGPGVALGSPVTGTLLRFVVDKPLKTQHKLGNFLLTLY
jgi:hypothetical protein